MRPTFFPVEIVSESEHSQLWCSEFVVLEGLLWWEPQPGAAVPVGALTALLNAPAISVGAFLGKGRKKIIPKLFGMACGSLTHYNSVFSMVWNNGERTDGKKKKCIRSVSQAPAPAIPHKTFATGDVLYSPWSSPRAPTVCSRSWHLNLLQFSFSFVLIQQSLF